MDRKRGGGVGVVCGGGKRDRKGEETVGEPNKVQNVVMRSQDLSWGKS